MAGKMIDVAYSLYEYKSQKCLFGIIAVKIEDYSKRCTSFAGPCCMTYEPSRREEWRCGKNSQIQAYVGGPGGRQWSELQSSDSRDFVKQFTSPTGPAIDFDSNSCQLLSKFHENDF